MNTRTLAAAFAAAALLSLTACTESADPKPAAPESQDVTPSPPRTPSSAPPAEFDTGSEPPASAPAAADPTAAETAELPNMVGKILQTAQDDAQAAGFYGLTSSDALGESRFQALDRNWKVCSQTPGPGTHPTDTVIDFATVKVEENCP